MQAMAPQTDIYNPPAAARQQRMAPYHKMMPLLYIPTLYLLRFGLRGRVAPATQHKIFIAATLGALSHAGFVMASDSTT